MDNILEQIREIGVVPVIAISNVEKAVPLAMALAAGGIPCAEVTFRTAEGEECIRRIAAQVPEIILGAGTVLTIQQAERAIDAGVKFLVSPGFNPNVVSYAIERNMLIIPGCVTPTEMETAMEKNIYTIKFFPAEQAGGLAYIKAVSAPYSKLKYMPTGGINAGNLGEYMSFEKIIACGASWMAANDLIEQGKFTEITCRCKKAVEIVKTSRMRH